MKRKTIKRHSKYYMECFGEWVCTYVDIAFVSGKNLKSFGKRNYYYIFERLTSDNKAFKMVRLNSTQASKVYKGLLSVEEVAEKKLQRNLDKFKEKVSYQFLKD